MIQRRSFMQAAMGLLLALFGVGRAAEAVLAGIPTSFIEHVTIQDGDTQEWSCESVLVEIVNGIAILKPHWSLVLNGRAFLRADLPDRQSIWTDTITGKRVLITLYGE